MAFVAVTSLLLHASVAQEETTLPPPCPINGTHPPSSLMPPFTLPLTNGSALSLPGLSLPLIVMAVDEAEDPGGWLLATDSVELDAFLSAPPPPVGTIVFLSYSLGGGAQLAATMSARLALQPPDRAAAWRARLAFGAPSLPELRAAGSPLVSVLDGWAAPRLWVSSPSALPGWRTPRVDGFYECFQWPAAVANFTLVGELLEGCGSTAGFPPIIPPGTILLVNATEPAGRCPPDAAVAWVRANAPNASGAVISAPTPPIVGRDCADAFVDAAFFPFLVGGGAGGTLGAALAAGGGAINVSVTTSCGGGTWLSVDGSGLISPMGWRKYTEAGALRWALDSLLHTADVVTLAAQAAAALSILPPRTLLNNASLILNIPDRDALLKGVTGATLDLTLQCPGGVGEGDNPCGAWDRIINAYAVCGPAGGGAAAGGGNGGGTTAQRLDGGVDEGNSNEVGGGGGERRNSPSYESSSTAGAPVEIARWITPFRRSTGRWLTDGSVLLGLIANTTWSASESERAESERVAVAAVAWQCTITVSSCCEQWLGALDFLLFNSSLDLTARDDIVLGLAAADTPKQSSSRSYQAGVGLVSMDGSALTPYSPPRDATPVIGHAPFFGYPVRSIPTPADSNLVASSSTATADTFPALDDAGGAVSPLAPATAAGAIPGDSIFAALPLVFPSMRTHFDGSYNANRTLNLTLPPSPPITRAVLWALITGHGSDPPPPAGQGCEYAPTSHAFALGPPGRPPVLSANSTVAGGERYMGAGSELGCADSVRSGGVISNQHGDWRDGRNGWCPGQAVQPLLWDVTDAVVGTVVSVTYSALSYYVGGSHPSADGCGGEIYMSATLLLMSEVTVAG